VTEKCSACGTVEKIQQHHISYDPEITIMVCKTCHGEIHHSDKFKNLEPDLSMKEAYKKEVI